MTNKAFDIVRLLSEVVLSAFGALWFALSEIWGPSVFPYGEEVLATCAALSTFLGVFTTWQRAQYNKQKGEENAEDLSKPVEPDGE